jgi:hypothetical protein
MAERKLGSKRGEYAELEAKAGKEKGVWEVRSNKKPDDLKRIDKERNDYSKQIDNIKLILYDTIVPANYKEKREAQDNVEKWVNSKIYGTKVKGNIKDIKDTKINVNSQANYVIAREKAKRDMQETLRTKKYPDYVKRLYKSDADYRRATEIRIKGIDEDNKIKKAGLKELLTKEEYDSLFETKTPLEERYAKFENPERTVSIDKLLKEGRRIYALKKPLDEDSKKIRRNYNRSFKSIYDAIRYARIDKITGKETITYKDKQGKEHKKKIEGGKARIWFNGKPYLASQFKLEFDIDTKLLATDNKAYGKYHGLQAEINQYKRQLTKENIKTLSKEQYDTIVKKRISAEKTYDKFINNYKINGKPIKINERYILPKGAISEWQLGATSKFTVSANPPSSERIVEVKKLVKPAQDKITFQQDNSGQLFTSTNIKRLFDKAEKESGQRVIYINNQAMTETDFQEISGLWYITAYAMANIQAGVSDLSLTYNPSYYAKTNELIKERQKIAQKPIIAELNSVAMLGGKQQNLHIIIYTLDAFVELKNAMKTRREGVKNSWIATQYSLTESMSKQERARLSELRTKSQVLLNDNEKKELEHLNEMDKINVVAEVQGGKMISDEELALYQQSHTEYLVLSWTFDKAKNTFIFGVVLKSNTLNIMAGEMELHYEG